MRRRWRRASRKDPGDINITAFMNLMVILVPFLLITAVFSRITILELNLPPASSAEAKDDKPQLQLEVIVRKDVIEVGDRRVGLIKRIENTVAGYDLAKLSELLQQIKARHPEKLDASVLLESDIPYDSLVQVMDAVRVAETVEDGKVVMGELFPEISIGDAPQKSMVTASRKKGNVK
jgi:biopolymer transport protein ExbD